MNDAAMESRKLVLERAGHHVTQARDLREVRASCEASSFDVVVIGQWLNSSEKRRVTDAVLTSCKSAKILELHTGTQSELPNADAHLQVTATEPQDLIEAVDRLLKTPRKNKARQVS